MCPDCRQALAFAREHVVHGRATFPAMSLLELAAAAGRGVRDDGAPRVVVITGAAVAAMLELPVLGSGELQCCVTVVSGGVEVDSMSGHGLTARHLSAVLESAAVNIILSLALLPLYSNTRAATRIMRPKSCC